MTTSEDEENRDTTTKNEIIVKVSKLKFPEMCVTSENEITAELKTH